ncbi:MAG: thiamine pyrophosphate-dependent enzyme, partial [Clostridiales bacterium]
YALGSAKPFNAIDTTICMGASISMGHGAQKIFDRSQSPMRVVSVLGDSTFFHTGINSLINVAYNQSATVNVILDNRITGMTGHQENPGSGYTAKGEPTNLIEIDKLVTALGFKHVRTVDPNDLQTLNETLDEFLALDEPSVLITRWPCALKKFSAEDKEEFTGAFSVKYRVNQETCIGCRICMGAGCPALSFNQKLKKAQIDRMQCLGCAVCAQICPKDAIGKEEK